MSKTKIKKKENKGKKVTDRRRSGNPLESILESSDDPEQKRVGASVLRLVLVMQWRLWIEAHLVTYVCGACARHNVNIYIANSDPTPRWFAVVDILKNRLTRTVSPLRSSSVSKRNASQHPPYFSSIRTFESPYFVRASLRNIITNINEVENPLPVAI